MGVRFRTATLAIAIAGGASVVVAACSDSDDDVTVQGAAGPGSGDEAARGDGAEGPLCWRDTILDYTEGEPDGPTTPVEAIQEVADVAERRSEQLGADDRQPTGERSAADVRAQSYRSILENLEDAAEPTDRENAQTYAWSEGDLAIELELQDLDGIGWRVVNERFAMPNEVCERQQPGLGGG